MQLQFHDYPEELTLVKQRFGIVGNSPVLMEAIARAVRVAPIDLSVLVTGESGTGKEFFPQIIHGLSPRKHARYIAVNCGAIPEGTIDSELFGHEKGAFTGAVATRKGYFEEADGGTIFLDEVGELPLTTQARLLRVLESGEFIKVGSSVVQKSNVRIVAATNVDMAKAVAEGRFREDLYYRLSTVSISVPPLRDRGSDIVLLARKFATSFAERYTMPKIVFDDSARDLMMSFRWPGNVRQLKNVVEQIALFHSGESVDATMLRPYLPVVEMGLSIGGSSSSAHVSDYSMEREMLLGMIMRLQQQVDALKEQIKPVASHSQPSSFIETVEPVDGNREATTQSIVKFQPFCSAMPPVSPAFGGMADGRYARNMAADEVAASSSGIPATLEETEKETIRRALDRNGGKRKATASELNISERTLYRKIKEYGIE